MNILFATLYNLKDINKGSGTYHYMYKALINQNHKVLLLPHLDYEFPILSRLFQYFTKRVLKKKYFSYMDPFIAKEIGNKISKGLYGKEFDFILTNDYLIAGYVKTKKPVVLWTDSIFPKNYKMNTHPWLNNMPWFAVKFYKMIVSRALRTIDLCIVPGDWHKKEISKYDIIEKRKILKIPFGANISEFVFDGYNSKTNIKKKLNILFVGKDQRRKSLNLVISVVQELKQRGLNVFLDVVGVDSQGVACDGEIIKFHGFLNKKNNDDLKKILSLYKKSNIYLMPSIAEGFGIVYMEAAAFGTPSIGFKTQGVTEAVKDMKTGRLLDLGSSSSDFANTIISWHRNPKLYKKLCIQARKHYEDNGKWNSLIFTFLTKVNEHLRLNNKIMNYY